VSDWSEFLLQARIHLKTAENQLCLAGSLNDELSDKMRTEAEQGLYEAIVGIRAALAAVRSGR
jgi:hypothetical protein